MLDQVVVVVPRVLGQAQHLNQGLEPVHRLVLGLVHQPGQVDLMLGQVLALMPDQGLVLGKDLDPGLGLGMAAVKDTGKAREVGLEKVPGQAMVKDMGKAREAGLVKDPGQAMVKAVDTGMDPVVDMGSKERYN